MADTPAPLPSLGLLDGLGEAIAEAQDPVTVWHEPVPAAWFADIGFAAIYAWTPLGIPVNARDEVAEQSANQGGDPAFLPHIGLLLAAGGSPPDPDPEPEPTTTTGGGGFAWAASRKKRRYDYVSPPTREQMAERVRKQREALGILPNPAQKRIEAAVKKEARRAAPSLAPLAPVAVEVAQDTGAPLQNVIDAIQAAYDYQVALGQARIQADAAQRAEQQRQAEEQARVQAEAAEQEWQRRLVELRAADDELLRQDEEARKQAIATIRQVQKALLALISG